MGQVFKAIAHDGRRRLLTRVGQEPGLTLTELLRGLRMTRQAVSQHLEILESAGLVATRWDGREKLHFLNPVPLQEAYEDWMAPLLTREARSLMRLREAIEEPSSAAGRKSKRQ